MNTPKNTLVPNTTRILVVKCADGSVCYCFEGNEPDWEIPVNLASLTPMELRAIADHKEKLIMSGFKNFS